MAVNFFTLPSKDPAMDGGPLLLSFGLHCPEAIEHCGQSDEDVIINNRFPTFRNEMSDCLRTGMLSALHYLDPECRLDMTGLRRILCDNQDAGTSIATAAIMFNRLGIAANAFASSFERIEKGPLEMAQDMGVIKQQVIIPERITATVYHGHIVICAIDPYAMYDLAISCSHAVLVTGGGKDIAVIHDSMRPPEAPGYHGERNSIRLWNQLEKGRAAHDYHTLVINGQVPDMAFHRKAVHEALNKGARFTPRLLAIQEKAPPPAIRKLLPEVEGVNFTPRLSQTFTNTVPFVRNTGNNSVAAAGLSAMRFYNRTLKLNLKQLEKMLQHKPAEPLQQLGTVFTKLGYKTKLHKVQKLSHMQIRKALAKKQLPICTVDYNRLHKPKGTKGKLALRKVQLHTVCVVGFDYSQIVLHESGSAVKGLPHTPYYIVPTAQFEKSRIPNASTLVVQRRAIRKTPALTQGA